MDRHTLLLFALKTMIEHTGLPWIDSSYKNDLCDSVLLENFSGKSYQLFVPNSNVDNYDNEDIPTYALGIYDNATHKWETDEWPTFKSIIEVIAHLNNIFQPITNLYANHQSI